MPFKNLEHDSFDEKGLKLGRIKAAKVDKQYKDAEDQEKIAKKKEDQKKWMSPLNPLLWNDIDTDEIDSFFDN